MNVFLKWIEREDMKIDETYWYGYKEGKIDGYKEAIDDFAEKVIEQLKEYAFDMSLENPDCKAVWLDRAIQIINELSSRTAL